MAKPRSPTAKSMRTVSDMLQPDIEALPWAEQLRLDDGLYRRQIAYLLTHSHFYQEKLGRAGMTTSAAIGGLDGIGQAAAHREGRTARRLQRRRCRSARIWPCPADGDRAHLFDQRHHRNAELYSADRGRPRRLGARLGAQLRGLGRQRRASASSRPITPGRSSPARRSAPSTGSASAISRSAPATPSG